MIVVLIKLFVCFYIGVNFEVGYVDEGYNVDGMEVGLGGVFCKVVVCLGKIMCVCF